MNKFQRAAEVLTKEINRIDDLTLLRDHLEKVGSSEQATIEIEGRLDTLRKQEDATKARVLDLEQRAATAVIRAKEAADQAQADAEKVIAAAQEKAKAILAEAERKASDKITVAEGRVVAVTAELEAVTKRRDETNAEAKAAAQALADVKRQRDALLQKLSPE